MSDGMSEVRITEFVVCAVNGWMLVTTTAPTCELQKFTMTRGASSTCTAFQRYF